MLTALPAELPADLESRRLAAMRRYEILDTPPDGAFDRIAALAADVVGVPIAIVSLVDHDRIWFKARHGLDVAQIGRDPGLCASAILQRDPWVLPDAKMDPRLLANPLVAGEFGLRFYVGIPLRTGDGHALGTLCVIDREPREISARQIEHLKALAGMVMDQMDVRLAARHAVTELSDAVKAKDEALHQAELLAREIDHRVMNSLHLVSSLLSLQSRGLGDSEAAAQLATAASRVSAVSRVHQHLYLNRAIRRSDLKAYIQRLCEELSHSLQAEGSAPIAVEAIAAPMPRDKLVSLGLIVNELVTNAAKHGGGRIVVRLVQDGPAHYQLSVADDGPGLPAGFDPARSRGLGMKIVGTLAAQLGGRIEAASGAQTVFALRFPAPAGD